MNGRPSENRNPDMKSFNNILALIGKELRSLFGDKVLVVLIVWVFTALVYSAATGVDTDVRNAPVGIVDYDRSVLSRRIADALLLPHFATPQPVLREESGKLMDKGQVQFVLEFPPGFQRDVLAGRAPEVQLLADATNITQAGKGQAYIGQIFQNEVLGFTGQKELLEQAEPVRAEPNTQFNPNNTDSWLMAVAEVNNMVALITMVLVGAAVIRERERGTLEHLLVMPVSASELMLSKILANGLVITAAAILSMKFMVSGVIGVPVAGSLLLYAAGAALFFFCISSLAIMLATLAPTMPQYSLMMMPAYVIMLMFSGTSSPRSNMPETAQQISEYWPTTLFAEFTHSVLFRGADAETVWPKLAGMALTGLLFFGFALLRFRKMLEQQG